MPVSSLSCAENGMKFPVRFSEEPDQRELFYCLSSATSGAENEVCSPDPAGAKAATEPQYSLRKASVLNEAVSEQLRQLM